MTTRVRDCEACEINGVPHLVVANFQAASLAYETVWKVYKWDGSSCMELQSIATSGAWNWEAFAIDRVQYPAVANRRSMMDYEVDSKIYKWHGSLFVEFQSIPTFAAVGWCGFALNGVQHLAMANWRNDEGAVEINSTIYKWSDSRLAELLLFLFSRGKRLRLATAAWSTSTDALSGTGSLCSGLRGSGFLGLPASSLHAWV